MAFSVALVLGLILYAGRLTWEFRSWKRYPVLSPWAKPSTPIYVFLLYISPFTIIGLIFSVGYTLIQTLFGYNPFYAMAEFRLIGPPGAWIASVAFFGIASLWGICLALVALSTRARNT